MHHFLGDNGFLYLETQAGNISSNCLLFVPATQPCVSAGVNNTPFWIRKILLELASQILPRLFRISASSYPFPFANCTAIIFSR